MPDEDGNPLPGEPDWVEPPFYSSYDLFHDSTTGETTQIAMADGLRYPISLLPA